MILTIAHYIFIVLLQIVGFLFSASQKIRQLDEKYPEKSYKEIKQLYLDSEWSTFLGSGVILFLHVLVNAIIDLYFPAVGNTVFKLPFTVITVPYLALDFILSPFAGYFGQNVLFRFFGRAETVIKESIDKFGK